MQEIIIRAGWSGVGGKAEARWGMVSELGGSLEDGNYGGGHRDL